MLYVISLSLYKFSSTQIPVPKSIADKIQSWGYDNIEEDNIFEDPDDPTLGREIDSHITVKYGLHTSDSDKIKKVVSRFGNFKVVLNKVSKFESEKFDVIKIDVESKQLNHLNELISDRFINSDKHPIYKPHLTIAYVKKGSCNDLIGNNFAKGISWEVSEIDFCNKDGDKTSIPLS